MSGMQQAFQPTYYKVNSRRVEWRELRGNNGLLSCLLGYPFLRFGIDIGPNDDPAMDSVIGFEVLAESVPPNVLARLRVPLDQMLTLGFSSPLFYTIVEPVNGATYVWAVCRHTSGRALGRVCYRVHHKSNKTFYYEQFITLIQGGGFVVSSTGLPESLMPPEVELQNSPKAKLDLLLRQHEALVGPRPIRRIMTDDETAQSIESLHAAITQFHVRRGVYHQPRQLPISQPHFAPAPPPVPPNAMTAHAVSPVTTVAPPLAAAPADAVRPFDSEIEAKVQTVVAKVLEPNTKKSWVSNLLWLVISLVVFFVLGQRYWGWDIVLLIIPILLFHEAGHWVAMKLFGYRDVRMFFIPLLGAAVSGRHARMDGWKPVVVALAGPLPGIVLGAVLAVVYLFVRQPMLLHAAIMLLLLNGFNLLPIMPLDGGRVVHALLFSRLYALDVVFRALAVAALLGIALLFQDKFLAFLALVMVAGVFTAYSVGRAVDRLRPLLHDASFDATGQPTPPLVHAIVDGLNGRELLKRRGKTGVERLTALSREAVASLSVRPPGVGSTVLLGGTYVGSLLAIVAVAVTMFIATRGPLGNLFARGSFQQPYAVDLAAVERVGPSKPVRPLKDSITFVATYDDTADHSLDWVELLLFESDERRMMRFGSSLLVEIAMDDPQRDQISKILTGSATQCFEHTTGNTVSVSIEGKIPKDAEADLALQLYAYETFPPDVAVLAPWDEDAQLTPAQLNARRTLGALASLQVDYDDAKLRQIASDMGKAKEAAERRALSQAMEARQKEVRREAIDELLKDPQHAAYRQMVDHYESAPSIDHGDEGLDFSKLSDADRKLVVETHTAKYRQWQQELAAYVGRTAQSDNAEVNDEAQPADPQGIQLGYVIAEAGRFTVMYAKPASPMDGLYSLAVWLRKSGAQEVRYEFEHSGMTAEQLAADEARTAELMEKLRAEALGNTPDTAARPSEVASEDEAPADMEPDVEEPAPKPRIEHIQPAPGS